jgi:hypothetical protein
VSDWPYDRSVFVNWPYDRSVFVNCPFDRRYRPMLRAIMFAIHDCGFFARSALEVQDSSDAAFKRSSGSSEAQ